MFIQSYGFDTFINGTPCLSLGLITPQRPNIPSAKEKTTVFTLKDRDGSLYKHTGVYEDIKISVQFQFLTHHQNFNSKTRQIKSFFRNTSTLHFSDDPNWFYKVKDISISDIERNPQQGYGTLSVDFTCDPYAYSFEGMQKIAINGNNSELLNSYDTAYPVIKSETTGTHSLAINTKTIQFTNTYPWTFDTDLSLIYETTPDDEKINILTIGDNLKDFYLINGKNTIMCENLETSQVEEITITPNWRCLN